MATIIPNFYLKPPIDRHGRMRIVLQFKKNGQQLTHSCGINIDPANWNHKKQLSKDASINKRLMRMAEIVNESYTAQLGDGVPDLKLIKEKLNEYIKGKPVKAVPTVFEVLDDFISGKVKMQKSKDGRREKSSGTLANYKYLKLHVEEFEKAGHKIGWQEFNQDFVNAWEEHFKKLKTNTLAKDWRLLTAVINHAVSRGYIEKKPLLNTPSDVVNDEVYLRKEEIEHIYHSRVPPKLQESRDLFVLACLTGLRFSDVNGLKSFQHDPDGVYVRLKQTKTNDGIMSKLNPVALEICSRYRFKMPKKLLQTYNNQIKGIAKMCGLTEVGRSQDEPEAPLYSLLASHSARRSFCTNAFFAGVPVEDIMRVSGHRTRESFMKYLRHSIKESADRLTLITNQARQ